MKDDQSGIELHVWIDPQVEARIVAMILGETSEFEEDELERLMVEHPEMRVFKRRLEVVHYLMGEALKSANCEDWRLSPERREEVLAVLGVDAEFFLVPVITQATLVVPVPPGAA